MYSGLSGDEMNIHVVPPPDPILASDRRGHVCMQSGSSHVTTIFHSFAALE